MPSTAHRTVGRAVVNLEVVDLEQWSVVSVAFISRTSDGLAITSSERDEEHAQHGQHDEYSRRDVPPPGSPPGAGQASVMQDATPGDALGRTQPQERQCRFGDDRRTDDDRQLQQYER